MDDNVRASLGAFPRDGTFLVSPVALATSHLDSPAVHRPRFSARTCSVRHRWPVVVNLATGRDEWDAGIGTRRAGQGGFFNFDSFLAGQQTTAMAYPVQEVDMAFIVAGAVDTGVGVVHLEGARKTTNHPRSHDDDVIASA